MKTIEEILKSKGITETTKHHSYNYLYKSFIEANQLYTEQEIKKHLNKAAEEATCTEYQSSDIVEGYAEIDKESITGIKIELT